MSDRLDGAYDAGPAREFRLLSSRGLPPPSWTVVA
jgi:hypothetical protein